MMDEDKKEDVQEVVEDEDQEEQDIVDDDTAAEGSDFVKRSAEARSDLADAEKRLADAEKRLADAEKRLAEARNDLAEARSDLTVADQRLADAKKEKDQENIKQYKEDTKQCRMFVNDSRKYVNDCRNNVRLCQKHVHNMQIAAQEALNPSSRKRKREERRVDDAYKARKDRWDKLNEVLNKRKKSQAVETCDFSYVSWRDVVPIFRPIQKLQFSLKELPASINVDDLMKVIENYNHLTTGSDVSELQVLLFINAVICHICSGFQNLQFNYECDVSGLYVLASGRFELIMINNRTQRTICLTEAKKLDLEQSAAQCLVGCETISDQQGSDVVYGIVSSYFQWIFYASRNDGIFKHETSSIGCNGFYPNNRQQFEVLLKDIYSFICMVLE